MLSAPASVTRARACLVLAAVLWSLGSVFMRLLGEPLGLGLNEPKLTQLQIACYRGLSVKGGAAGVGTATTSSVVTAIATVIGFDTIYNIVYTVFFPT